MYPDVDMTDNDAMVNTTLNICEQFQDYVNIGMDKFATDFVNIDKHSFSFKQELIASSGFFITKKRYALWIVNNEGTPMEKMTVKGIDIVRSNFPEAFKTLLRNILVGILHGEKKENMDNEASEFKKNVKNTPIEEIAIATGVKNLKKYTNISTGKPTKGTPAHVRAALNHNWLLNHKKLSTQYRKIVSNSKIKWVYLKSNPYRFDKIAFKVENNSPEIMEFIEQYIDKNKIFKQLVERKLDTFYNAMRWARVNSTVNTLDRFFI
jgi:DNA polymerase elongation subunit (family B)